MPSSEDERWYTHIASGVLLCISATAPKSGGTQAPPDTAPTIKPDPRFEYLPRPRIPRATVVGKIMLSKNSVRKSIDIPVFPRCVIDGAMNTMIIVMYTRYTYRGRMNFIRAEPANRPAVKAP